MNDPRDFLAFAHYGNLGMLLLGLGLLGVLIHHQPIRKWLSAGVGFLGILLLNEGAAAFHGTTISVRGSMAAALLAVIGCSMVFRSANATETTKS